MEALGFGEVRNLPSAGWTVEGRVQPAAPTAVRRSLDQGEESHTQERAISSGGPERIPQPPPEAAFLIYRTRGWTRVRPTPELHDLHLLSLPKCSSRTSDGLEYFF